MGVFYYIHSVALIEDLPIKEHYTDLKEFYVDADAAYSKVKKMMIEFLFVVINTQFSFSILRMHTTVGLLHAFMFLHWLCLDNNFMQIVEQPFKKLS